MDIHSTNYIQRQSPTWRDFPIDLISRTPIARWAPIPRRLIVGYGFMEHASLSWPGARMRFLRFCRHLACRTSSYGMAHDLG